METGLPPHFHKVYALGADKGPTDFALEGVDGAGVGDAESKEEGVVLEDLHVAGDEVAEVLADQVELVHVRLPRPQRVALKLTGQCNFLFRLNF